MSDNPSNKTWQVGSINKKVIELTGVSIQDGAPIIIGEQNILHMKNDHPLDYEKYGSKIEEILSDPTYIAKHPAKDSIEYIKVYTDNNDEHALVAVRITGKGTYFARTLFIMSDEKIERYKEKGAFKSYI